MNKHTQHIFWAILVLLVFGALLHITCFDYWLQDQLYRLAPHWRQSFYEPWHTLLYKFPKILLGTCMVYWLIACFRRTTNSAGQRFLTFGLALLFAISLIVLVVYLKWWTDVSCPWSHLRYGGTMLPETWFGHGSQAEYFECFPAGHATSGYALLGWLFCVEQRYRLRIWVGALSWGTCLGCYQMLRGAHYFSHTLTTAAIAVFLVLFFSWVKSFLEKTN